MCFSLTFYLKQYFIKHHVKLVQIIWRISVQQMKYYDCKKNAFTFKAFCIYNFQFKSQSLFLPRILLFVQFEKSRHANLFYFEISQKS